PVVPDQREPTEPKRAGQFDDVAAQCRQLAASDGRLGAEPGGAEAAQVGRDRAEAGRVEWRDDAIPGTNVVRPAVQEDDRQALPRPPLFVGYFEEFGLHDVKAGAHRLALDLAIAHATPPPNDQGQLPGRLFDLPAAESRNADPVNCIRRLAGTP